MITLVFWLSTSAVVYGLSILRLEKALVWFREDTRAKLPRRIDRGFVVAVILAIAPVLAALTLARDLKACVDAVKLRRIIRRLPLADAEQAHVVDEIQHPDFYDAAHHPAGHIGGTR